MTYIVLCRGDVDNGREGEEQGLYGLGPYQLATRTVFAGRDAAEAYAKTIASCREPIVVALPLAELRVGEDRGRLDYWESK